MILSLIDRCLTLASYGSVLLLVSTSNTGKDVDPFVMGERFSLRAPDKKSEADVIH